MTDEAPRRLDRVDPAAREGDPSVRRPAFYAARAHGWGDWWTLLHPPYTAWHLAYVAIGASLAVHPSPEPPGRHPPRLPARGRPGRARPRRTARSAPGHADLARRAGGHRGRGPRGVGRARRRRAVARGVGPRAVPGARPGAGARLQPRTLRRRRAQRRGLRPRLGLVPGAGGLRRPDRTRVVERGRGRRGGVRALPGPAPPQLAGASAAPSWRAWRAPSPTTMARS